MTAPTTSSTTAASIPTTTTPGSACRADQLAIHLAGIEGAAGSLIAAYRIANTSVSCAVPPGVKVDLLDRSDRVLLSASNSAGGLTLASGTVAEFLLRFTRNDMPRGGAPCPSSSRVVPASLRVTFGTNLGPIRISAVTSDGSRIDVCNGDLDVSPVRFVS